MIHMSQVKVPLENLLKKAPAPMVKKGILSLEEEELVKESAAKSLRISTKDIGYFHIEKKSMDARKKQIQYIYRVDLTCPNEKKIVKRYGKNDVKWEETRSLKEDTKKDTQKKVSVHKEPSPVIAGFGPAGMFAALTLARAGRKPIIIERGMKVEERQKAVDAFWNGGPLNTESNVQFGEGGAGTFSDGKLNTMVKDPTGRNKMVLETFVKFGAPSEILYLQKPHIGTDCLKGVVKAIREEILSLGGEFYFETRLEKFIVNQGQLRGIIVRKGQQEETISCSQLVLATGHSARDTFGELKETGIYMEPKPFAVGVRVEHLQEMIGQSQYGEYYTKLPAADYKLTYQTKDKRGVYSFCMCPGGYVVNASSEKGRLAVNGMSYYNREGRNANSAIVVTVSPQDFAGDSVLGGMEFQRKLEEAAYREGKGKIPVQLLGDFMESRVSTSFGMVRPEMKGGYTFGNVRKILPVAVGDAIAEGMTAFERKIQGYSREDTILSGVESRTSSPVRIVRDESLQSNVAGIYPCGEGAGYAGGITSAAMDGIRVAQQMIEIER